MNGKCQGRTHQWGERKKNNSSNTVAQLSNVCDSQKGGYGAWLIIITLRIIKSICGGERKNALTGKQQELTRQSNAAAYPVHTVESSRVC